MLLHADGFDNYGTAATNASLNKMGYAADVSTNVTNNSGGIIPPYGIGMLNFTSYQGGIQRFISPVGEHSGQILLNYPVLPIVNNWGYHLSLAGTQFLNFMYTNVGTIIVSSSKDSTNTGAYLGIVPPGYFKLGVFQNWEFSYTPNTGGNNGVVKVFLEGTKVLQINGLSILAVPDSHYVGNANIQGASPGTCVKSWIIRDSQTAYCNVPLGPRKVGTRVGNGVGANNAWVVIGAANAAAATANIPPNGAQYIEGDNVGDITDFTLPIANINVTGVDGVIVKAFMQKTGSGAATAKLGVESGASTINSPDIAPGIGFAYWDSGFFQTDPGTGVPMTKAQYSALGMRITRSA